MKYLTLFLFLFSVVSCLGIVGCIIRILMVSMNSPFAVLTLAIAAISGVLTGAYWVIENA